MIKRLPLLIKEGETFVFKDRLFRIRRVNPKKNEITCRLVGSINVPVKRPTDPATQTENAPAKAAAGDAPASVVAVEPT